jgi:nucleoside-diphosphate-sugar epimerase
MANKKILITGINGFLGSALAKSLIGEYDIIGIETSIDNISRIKDIAANIRLFADDPQSIKKKYFPTSTLTLSFTRQPAMARAMIRHRP